MNQPEVESLILANIKILPKKMTYHHQPKTPNYMAVQGFKPGCGTLWIHLSRTGEYVDLCLSGESMAKNLQGHFRQNFGPRTGTKGHNLQFWRVKHLSDIATAIQIYNRSL